MSKFVLTNQTMHINNVMMYQFNPRKAFTLLNIDVYRTEDRLFIAYDKNMVLIK